MEGFSPIADTLRLPVQIPIYPCFFDHHVESRAVLPAVEAMQVLAMAVNSYQSDFPVTALLQGRFEKFLYIPAGSRKIDAIIEMTFLENRDIRARLMTKTQSGKSAITRSLIHAEALFSQKSGDDQTVPLDQHAFLEGICREIPPEIIYKELVPFGPSYRNITAPLYITESGAVAQLTAAVQPNHPKAAGLLGFSFILDAAFHTACVWAQAYLDTVAFPVGFEQRNVYYPTRPGCNYFSRMTPCRVEPNLLICDIWIYDSEGRLQESIHGVQMKDVSAGRVKPPSWIKQTDASRNLKHIQEHCSQLCVFEIKTLMPFAQKALSNDEKKRWQSMGEKRRRSFMSSRLACKTISRRLSGNDLKTPAENIHTLSPDSARPCCRRIDSGTAVACSVSHDDRFVIAVTADDPVGIDVEEVSPRVLRSKHLFMTTAEECLLKSADLGDVQTAIRIWSIKEAVAKALGINLAKAWQRAEVKQVYENQSFFQVDTSGIFTAVHDTIDNHVFTLVRLPQDRT